MSVGNTNTSPLKNLKCSCCGGYTLGRQWHNRDTGWGLCNGCVSRCFKGCDNDNEEFERVYGKRGVHCDIRASSITFELFSKYASASKLLNHGRKWEVFFNGLSIGFSDSEDEAGALREVHERDVNNALYGNTADCPIPLRCTMPPKEVLVEYPLLVEKFSIKSDI